MRIPGFIIEHPLESVIGGILLLTLLFGSAHAAPVAPLRGHAQTASGRR